MNNTDLNTITQRILSSKKYRGLHPFTVERIVSQCTKRYPTKRIEKKARNLLHQVWGAYYANRPDFARLVSEIPHTSDTQHIQDYLTRILSLHASTRERIPLLDSFYSEIFQETGIPESIADYASGLNPLTLPWMHLPEDTRYTAYDIDSIQNSFIKQIFAQLPIHPRAEIRERDLAEPGTPFADVAFLFKTLPLLDHQLLDAESVISAIPCNTLVVSYPRASISGRAKGMEKNYPDRFARIAERMSLRVKLLKFSTEIVFLLDCREASSPAASGTILKSKT
ncbi:MAG: hypothetical protein PHG63_00415 [Candidatus Dojkabacteria bacterium]|nr:hypothetical protein [Candidatus Dojkabacteria bacterium]